MLFPVSAEEAGGVSAPVAHHAAPGAATQDNKQRMCTEIIAEGFVQAFVEFFHLTHRPDPDPGVALGDSVGDGVGRGWGALLPAWFVWRACSFPSIRPCLSEDCCYCACAWLLVGLGAWSLCGYGDWLSVLSLPSPPRCTELLLTHPEGRPIDVPLTDMAFIRGKLCNAEDARRKGTRSDWAGARNYCCLL